MLNVLAIDSTNGFLPYLTPEPNLATLDFTGTSGNDRLMGVSTDNHLFGLPGKDRIFGAGGDDTLLGGAGKDWLDGGRGADRLVGGEGADVFHFGPGNIGLDVIADYEVTKGGEDIELSKELIPGIASFKALQSLISEDAAGNAVINVGMNDRITILGILKSDLSANDFVFL